MRKKAKSAAFGYEKNVRSSVSDEQEVLYRRDGRVLLTCRNKTLSHYALREGTVVIDEKAFSGCELLEEISIPNSVSSIGSWAFQDCKSLTKIFIPASVVSIDFGVFSGCERLEMIEVAEDNPAYCSINGVLYSKDISSLVKCPPTAPFTSFDIPESVRVIESFAFECCSRLTQVTIGRNVICIRNGAFQGCKSLSRVRYNAIACRSTKGMHPVFLDCHSLTQVEIGDNVVELPDDLFIHCGVLSEINIPGSVTTIGNGVFRLCPKLSYIYIPGSVSTIGVHAFSTDGPLHVEMADDNQYYRVVDNVLFSKDMTELLEVMGGSYSYSFKSYVIPDGVTRIGDHAFDYCDGLEMITIPDSVTDIGDYALAIVDGLKSIILPRRLSHLGEFSLCAYDLRAITSLNPSPPQCKQLVTYDYMDADGYYHSYIHKNCVLLVPAGCKEAYTSADEWKEFERIEEIEYN